MLKIAFVTCADLSRFFVSEREPLLTHDDQAAGDFLREQGHEVKALIWGEPVSNLKKLDFDSIIMRSPWDYSVDQQRRRDFLLWIKALEKAQLPLQNPASVMLWNLDKRYLFELQALAINIPETLLLEFDRHSIADINHALGEWKKAVLKPCIGAGARDTFLLSKENISEAYKNLEAIEPGRHFLLQPFLPTICDEGEWSLIFINNSYSHAVLKLPKKGDWRVQDELGGSVHSAKPPLHLKQFALNTYEKLLALLKSKFEFLAPLLYARIDLMPGPLLGEIELCEPELFFLDRPHHKPNHNALLKFHEGIRDICG